MLQYLSACCEWGFKHKLVKDNPFKGLASNMPKRRSLIPIQMLLMTQKETL
jgi:hypothetical protein